MAQNDSYSLLMNFKKSLNSPVYQITVIIDPRMEAAIDQDHKKLVKSNLQLFILTF